MTIRSNVCLRYIVFSLPFLTEPSENFREILQNVAKPHGVSNMRKLGHLNNFIKVKHITMLFVPFLIFLYHIVQNSFEADDTNIKLFKTVDSLLSDL